MTGEMLKALSAPAYRTTLGAVRDFASRIAALPADQRGDARDVGRVCRRLLPEGHRYYWTIYISGHVPQVSGVPISGLAVTLDEASAAFKRAYDAMREKAALPRP
jgi:hypothetical protein